MSKNAVLLRNPLRRPAAGRVLIVALVAVAATLIGVIAARQWLGQPAEYLAASIYPEARSLRGIQLTDADGQPFTEERLQGRISLLFFGFTNCPDICPDTLAMLAEADAKLDAMRVETRPRVVFISVDPERDGAETMRDYVQYFNPEFIAVSGDDDALNALTSQVGAMYRRGAPDESGFYTVDHSGMVVIVDSDGRMIGRFPLGSDADSIAADLFRMIRAGL